MRKTFYALLIVLCLCFITSCSNEKGSEANNISDAPTSGVSSQAQSAEKSAEPEQSTDGIDVDLTKLSSTMVYSEVYNMMYSPDDYIGKTVKMTGKFAYYEDPDTKAMYFACIIADATACCSQGLEFDLAGEHKYPDDYPQAGNEITVTGTFELREENGFKYCRLTDAALKDQRNI